MELLAPFDENTSYCFRLRILLILDIEHIRYFNEMCTNLFNFSVINQTSIQQDSLVFCLKITLFEVTLLTASVKKKQC